MFLMNFSTLNSNMLLKLKELEQVFDPFPKYHLYILLGDFNAKVWRENIFKPTIWNDSIHLESNDNGIRIVNFFT